MKASPYSERAIFKKTDSMPIKTLLMLEEQGFTGICELIFEDAEVVFESRILFLEGLIVSLDLYIGNLTITGEKAVEFIRRNALFTRRGIVWFDLNGRTTDSLIIENMLDHDRNSLIVPLKVISLIS